MTTPPTRQEIENQKYLEKASAFLLKFIAEQRGLPEAEALKLESALLTGEEKKLLQKHPDYGTTHLLSLLLLNQSPEGYHVNMGKVAENLPASTVTMGF